MDLTKQPPRRPSNANMAGIVGLARMTDKGRGHNAETIGLYLYGADSKLDTSILQFVHMGFEEFADAADAMSDDDLSALVLEKAQRSEAEIEAFNHKNLTREPEDDSHRQILKERLPTPTIESCRNGSANACRRRRPKSVPLMLAAHSSDVLVKCASALWCAEPPCVVKTRAL
jgi:hypothetical protein